MKNLDSCFRRNDRKSCFLCQKYYLPKFSYNVKWDGKDESGQQAAAGIYFYRIQANEFNNTKKLVVLK